MMVNVLVLCCHENATLLRLAQPLAPCALVEEQLSELRTIASRAASPRRRGCCHATWASIEAGLSQKLSHGPRSQLMLGIFAGTLEWGWRFGLAVASLGNETCWVWRTVQAWYSHSWILAQKMPLFQTNTELQRIYLLRKNGGVHAKDAWSYPVSHTLCAPALCDRSN